MSDDPEANKTSSLKVKTRRELRNLFDKFLEPYMLAGSCQSFPISTMLQMKVDIHLVHVYENIFLPMERQ